MNKRSFSEICYVIQCHFSYNAENKLGKQEKKKKFFSCNTQIGLAVKLDQQMLFLGHHCLVNLSYSPNLWILSTM